jgi:hypothetical protein
MRDVREQLQRPALVGPAHSVSVEICQEAGQERTDGRVVTATV